MLCFQSVLYCIVLYNDVFTFLYVAVGNKLLLLLLLLLLDVLTRKIEGTSWWVVDGQSRVVALGKPSGSGTFWRLG